MLDVLRSLDYRTRRLMHATLIWKKFNSSRDEPFHVHIAPSKHLESSASLNIAHQLIHHYSPFHAFRLISGPA